MKSKLGIIMILFSVASFFIYRAKDVKGTKNNKEILINGAIVSSIGEKPLEGVTIAIQGTNPKTVSNVDGEYAIMALGSQELVFRHRDYKTKVVVAKDAKFIKMEVADSTYINEVNRKLAE